MTDYMKNMYDGIRMPVALIGGFKCRLTSEEQNAWHTFIKAHPKWSELEEAQIEVASVRDHNGFASVEDHANALRVATTKMSAVEDDLFNIGAEWVAALYATTETQP